MNQTKTSPRVSVVLCTYYGTAYLEKQLQSICKQTLQPFEVIVCDDNSSHETLTILERFRDQASFSVRIVVNEQRLGSTKNFDQALELASGDFLALCDQDDIWLPQKLAKLAHLLNEFPEVGGVFSDASLIDANGRAASHVGRAGSEKTLWTLHGFNRRKQTRFVNGGAIDLLLQHDIVTGATLMVRASLRSTWHPIPASWVHDGWITWMLAVQSRLELVAEPLVAYRIHAQQQLGVGGGSRAERLKHMRATERARFARVADQFFDLRERIREVAPSNIELIALIERKILLLRRRSQLPHSLLARIWCVLVRTQDYRRFARGWRSMRKDLWLS